VAPRILFELRFTADHMCSVVIENGGVCLGQSSCSRRRRRTVTPFKVHVPEAELDDLKKRLAAARLPDRGPAADWSEGVPLAKAQALIEYWRTSAVNT